MKQKSHIRPIVYVMITVFLTIGYAYLTSSLSINGASLLKSATWDVHFENIQVMDGSVTGEQVIDEPEIDAEQTTVTFHVNLKLPGDYYEFTVDAVNAGTIDAMIDNYSDLELTAAQQKYLETSITYEDGEEVLEHQQLLAGDTAVYKVRVAYKLDLEADDLPSNPEQLDLEFTVEYVQRDNNAIERRTEIYSLYNVLKREAESGSGLALKYTGSHQDSMDETLSIKNIYHWYASDSDAATNISENMNNVIFGDHCWQMVRTTDTGGVKLIYNGEVDDNQCLTTRGNHIGYNGTSSLSGLNNNYYYGTDYSYNSSTGMFSLSGNTIQAKWSESVGPSLEDYYTCKLNDVNGSCSELYYIYQYTNATSAKVFVINSSSNSSTFGLMSFNKATGWFEKVGYMNNKTYTPKTKSLYKYQSYVSETSNLSVLAGKYYADTYSYDSSSEKYTLINPMTITSDMDGNDLVGKYYAVSPTYATVNYVHKYNASSNNPVYFYPLSKNESLQEKIDTTYTYGSDYTENGDGTYTITNATTIPSREINDRHNVLENKYLCVNATNNTCEDLRFVESGLSGSSFTYYSILTKLRYGKSFTYENGLYTITEYADDWIPRASRRERYTCFNESGICSELNYYFYQRTNTDLLYYFVLYDGDSIGDIVEQLLFADDVNTNDSIIKRATDLWFKKYLLNYNDYLEDTIFCNNREIDDYGTYDPYDTRYMHVFLYLKDLSRTSDISCNNVTDRFSTNNSYARLKYKVGLLTAPEVHMMNYGSVLYSKQSYYLMTPEMSERSINAYRHNIQVHIAGNDNYSSSRIPYTYLLDYENNFGLRPVISLKPGTLYSSGDGSMANPYVVSTN